MGPRAPHGYRVRTHCSELHTRDVPGRARDLSGVRSTWRARYSAYVIRRDSTVHIWRYPMRSTEDGLRCKGPGPVLYSNSVFMTLTFRFSNVGLRSAPTFLVCIAIG